MASARDILHSKEDTGVAVPAKRPKVFNRPGPLSPVEKEFVHQFVADQPREITTGQITALSRVMRRSRDAVKELINEAREDLASNIGDYVRAHKQAMNMALDNGDPKSLEVATRAAQWGMENIAIEGVRVVDKAKSEDTGMRIQVGVLIGGVNDQKAIVREAKVTPLSSPVLDAQSSGGIGGTFMVPSTPQGPLEELDAELQGGESEN